MQLTPLQCQLVLMAMDPAAAPGEQTAAAVAFFRSFRRDYRDGYALLADFAESSNTTRASVPSNHYGAVTMTFGKHRGRPLADIDAGYLLWVLDNVPTLSSSLRQAIEGHLQREYYAN